MTVIDARGGMVAHTVEGLSTGATAEMLKVAVAHGPATILVASELATKVTISDADSGETLFTALTTSSDRQAGFIVGAGTYRVTVRNLDQWAGDVHFGLGLGEGASGTLA